MGDTMTRQSDDHAISNARGWWSSIQEMVAAYVAAERDYENANDGSVAGQEAAEQTIHESVLSVEARSGWHGFGPDADTKPAEYRILLTTGGPALQLTGELSEYGEPETAELQIQDWFKPWTEWRPDDADKFEETLLTFARRFYFGE